MYYVSWAAWPALPIQIKAIKIEIYISGKYKDMLFNNNIK